LQIFDACTTFEVSCVSFSNDIGTTRATAFSGLLGLLGATAFALTAEMARAAAESSGILPVRARASNKVCVDLGSTNQKQGNPGE
jgi:hypothetical protein